MSQKSFALSWGRKMFFGLGWPLMSIIALSYFQTRIVPQSPLEIFYVCLTHVGHYGLLTAFLYFILYAPLTLLFPTYYFTRIWSLSLIMMSCLLIFIDSIIFSLYRFHINRFIIDLVLDGSGKDIFNLHPSVFIVAVSIFLTLVVYIWYRGEKIWRHMQRRFSNPNSSWYLVMIFFFVLISHLLHIYGDAYGNKKIIRHAQNFPIYFAATAKTFLNEADVLPEKIDLQKGLARDFYYPQEPLNCSAKVNKNIIFVTVNNWDHEEVSETKTPLLTHLSTHGKIFSNHRAVGFDPVSGIFSLFYALPATYMSFAKRDQIPPVFMDELANRNYEFGVFSEFSIKDTDLQRTVFLRVPVNKNSSDIIVDLKTWLDSKVAAQTSTNPYFIYLALSNGRAVEPKINLLMNELRSKSLLENSLIFLVGTNGKKSPDKITVPFIAVWPELKSLETNPVTTNLDIIPTLMKELWRCSSPVVAYADGQSFLDLTPRDSFIIGDDKDYQIMDYLNNHIITISPSLGYSVTDFDLKNVPRKKARKELILGALRSQARFRRGL
jgi:membrane-anchored protein YejM (alkaline phosphatase superfamily)